MVIIGVDPGKSGAIVVMLDGRLHKKFMIPTLGKVVDVPVLRMIFENIKYEFIAEFDKGEVFAVIEQVHAIFGCGAGTTFEFGRIFGMLEIAVAQFKYVEVPPKTWQKLMFLGIPEIRKPGKEYTKKDGTKAIRQGSLKTKEMALVAVKRLFPEVDLRATERSKIFHDGLVDALLLAEYARRTFS